MWMLPISWESWEAKMSKQFLFCVETTKQANTDYQYIRETILTHYIDSRENVIRSVYMESKSRYNSKSVLKEIDRKTKAFPGETHVIYFIDTDDYDISPEVQKDLTQIRSFCNSNGYDFVFFCKDVEDVFYGKRVPSTQKVRAVEQFKRNRMINTVDPVRLQCENYQAHHSNILNILDKYWIRKIIRNLILINIVLYFCLGIDFGPFNNSGDVDQMLITIIDNPDIHGILCFIL